MNIRLFFTRSQKYPAIVDALVARYVADKEILARRIVRWEASPYYQQEAHHAKNTLAQVDMLGRELRQELIAAKDAAALRALYKRVKRLDKLVSELHEMTKSAVRQWAEAILFAVALVFVVRTYIFGLYHVPTGSAEPNLLVGDRVWGNKMAYRIWGKPQFGDLVMFDDPNFKYSSNQFVAFYQKYVGFGLLGLPAGPENLVKRVIGLPGDVVELRVEGSKPVIYRNRELLVEPYVNPYPLILLKKSTGFIDFDSVGPFMVPWFLKKSAKRVWYTYIPGLDYSEQSYYAMSSADVIVDPQTGRAPVLLAPDMPLKEDDQPPMTVPAGKYWVMGDSRKNSKDSRFWGFLDEKFVSGRASFIVYSVDSEEPLWLFEMLKQPIRFWTKAVRWGRCFTSVAYQPGKKAGLAQQPAPSKAIG